MYYVHCTMYSVQCTLYSVYIQCSRCGYIYRVYIYINTLAYIDVRVLFTYMKLFRYDYL